MIDDTGLEEFNSRRANRPFLTRAAVALAAMSLPMLSLAACADESPPDDAIAAGLSTREVLALCDELRDAVESDPPLCGSDRGWMDALPSNETCLEADLSACSLTVGELRRCNEWALGAPCSFLDEVTLAPDGSGGVAVVECQLLEACRPFLPVF